MRLIVGLGNPGRQYEGTRHNAGWLVIDKLAERWRVPVDTSRFDGLLGEARRPVYDRAAKRMGDEPDRVVLLKPLTYMNLSGKSVQPAARWHKAAKEDILVVIDDMDLPLGKIRLRGTGSAGGQKGLADICRAMGTFDIPRLRVGIGRPTPPMDAVNWVLTKPTGDDALTFAESIVDAADAAEKWLADSLENAMNKVNTAG